MLLYQWQLKLRCGLPTLPSCGIISGLFTINCQTYTLCLNKNKQNYFCYNYVKLPPNLTIFGTKMANSLKLYEVHSFSIYTVCNLKDLFYNIHPKLIISLVLLIIFNFLRHDISQCLHAENAIKPEPSNQPAISGQWTGSGLQLSSTSLVRMIWLIIIILFFNNYHHYFLSV